MIRLLKLSNLILFRARFFSQFSKSNSQDDKTCHDIKNVPHIRSLLGEDTFYVQFV